MAIQKNSIFKGGAALTASSPGDTLTIRPADGYEVALHHVDHVGAGKLEIVDVASGVTVLRDNNSTGNCVHGDSVRLSYDHYAIYTNLSGAAQDVTYEGAYTIIPA